MTKVKKIKPGPLWAKDVGPLYRRVFGTTEGQMVLAHILFSGKVMAPKTALEADIAMERLALGIFKKSGAPGKAVSFLNELYHPQSGDEFLLDMEKTGDGDE